MSNFNLQLHITGACNCRCKHCYIEEYSSELSAGTIEHILWELLELENYFNEEGKPSVNITGGELFLHSDIDNVFNLLCRFKNKFDFRLLTNGTLIDENIAKRISLLGIEAVQVSIDGNEETHDIIRGKGNLKKVLAGIDNLKKQSVPVHVSFTANSLNYNQFGEVAEICRNHKADVLWSDRVVPFPGNKLLRGLTANETEILAKSMLTEKENILNYKSGLIIKNIRALQFLCAGEFPYRCTAGVRTAAINEKGDVYPCRRLPIAAGNIYEKSFKEIYLESDVFGNVRNSVIPAECADCKHSEKCRGGAKCQSLAVYGDLEHKDIGCWI